MNLCKFIAAVSPQNIEDEDNVADLFGPDEGDWDEERADSILIPTKFFSKYVLNFSQKQNKRNTKHIWYLGHTFSRKNDLV